MKIVEASEEGLKRNLKVVVDSKEIEQRYISRLDQVKGSVQLKGFRKGKVPANHIKKVYGRSLMSEVIQDTLRDTSQKLIEERKERPAAMPSITLSEDQNEINQILEGKKDLAYSLSFEVIPSITLTKFEAIELEKLEAQVDEETIQKSIDDLLKRAGSFEPIEDRKAEKGDRVTISYAGSIDGETFEGGSGDGLSLVLGNAGFIPGFEDGLIGSLKGDTRDIPCTFPEDYPDKKLSGKPAIFKVVVQNVEKPVEAQLNDDLAKAFGAENVTNLKDLITQQIKLEYDKAARIKLKKELLDRLEELHKFELPQSLVDREFEVLWKRVDLARKQQGQDNPDQKHPDYNKTEDELRNEYKLIAERRVRLALVVGEIGTQNKIEITQEEMRKALMEQARRYPGQEKVVYEYFEKTPGALQELRAPLFEDKIIDHLITKVKLTTKPVSRDALYEQVKTISEG